MSSINLKLIACPCCGCADGHPHDYGCALLKYVDTIGLVLPPPASHAVVDVAASGGGKLTGNHYYRVKVAHPIAPDVQPYTAECADIIEALGMTFNEGEAFKAIWRLAAGRQGKTKNAPQYDADKAAHYGERIAACVRNNSTPTTN